MNVDYVNFTIGWHLQMLLQNPNFAKERLLLRQKTYVFLSQFFAWFLNLQKLWFAYHQQWMMLNLTLAEEDKSIQIFAKTSLEKNFSRSFWEKENAKQTSLDSRDTLVGTLVPKLCLSLNRSGQPNPSFCDSAESESKKHRIRTWIRILVGIFHKPKQLIWHAKPI